MQTQRDAQAHPAPKPVVAGRSPMFWLTPPCWGRNRLHQLIPTTLHHQSDARQCRHQQHATVNQRVQLTGRSAFSGKPKWYRPSQPVHQAHASSSRSTVRLRTPPLLAVFFWLGLRSVM